MIDCAAFVDRVSRVVRGILHRKLGVSLSYDDGSRLNCDALEIYHDAIAQIFEACEEVRAGRRLPIDNPESYAARIVYNRYHDYLGIQHPGFGRLKNRVRYVLDSAPEFTQTRDEAGTLHCGLPPWESSRPAATAERVASLRENPAQLDARALPPCALEQMGRTEWTRLLSAAFQFLGGPVPVHTLVAILGGLFGVSQVTEISIDAFNAGEEGRSSWELASRMRSPEREAQLNRALSDLWKATAELPRHWMLAFVLNPPSPSREDRGDLEPLVVRGIVTVTEIGRTLALSYDDFVTLWRGLEIEKADGPALASLPDDDHRFAALWEFLPATDAIIGNLLGRTAIQIGGLRREAMRTLRGAMGGWR